MAITLRQLRYFLALTETGSFGVAAGRVHISQPALSQQIKELEAHLGVQLVERRPREIRLTRQGMLVRDRARVVLADLDDLEQTCKAESGLRGRLSLGVIPTVAPYLLPTALTRLRATDLSLDIRIREAQTAVLIDLLADGALDAAIVSQPLPEVGLVSAPLWSDRFLLAGSAARLAALRPKGRAPRPDAIPVDQLLLLDEGHCLADQALEVCGLGPSARPVDLGAASLSTLSGLVAQGFGLTLLPEIAVAAEARAVPDLALARFAAPEPARALCLVRRATAHDDGWFSALAELIGEAGEDLLAEARTLVDVA